MVTDEGWIDPRGITGIPCEYINVSFKKLNQLLLLLKRQLSPYPKEFLQVAANNHFFQVFAFRLVSGWVMGRSRGF